MHLMKEGKHQSYFNSSDILCNRNGPDVFPPSRMIADPVSTRLAHGMFGVNIILGVSMKVFLDDISI